MGGPAVKIQVKVNGTAHTSEVEPRLLLVHYLRDVLNLTGTHVGCDTSQCGACTIIVNGRSTKACNLFAVQADGADIMTIEGLAKDGQAPPDPGRLLGEARAPVRLLHAGHDHDGVPAAPAQPEADARRRSATSSRATSAAAPGYHNIVKAIQYAAEKMA